jgi:hypothetical protein
LSGPTPGGPSALQGTAHSGIAITTLGGLDEQSVSDLQDLGDAIAHEVARYLGAPGTINPQAFTAEQAFILVRNPAVVHIEQP